MLETCEAIISLLSLSVADIQIEAGGNALDLECGGVKLRLCGRIRTTAQRLRQAGVESQHDALLVVTGR